MRIILGSLLFKKAEFGEEGELERAVWSNPEVIFAEEVLTKYSFDPVKRSRTSERMKICRHLGKLIDSFPPSAMHGHYKICAYLLHLPNGWPM